jgi:uncharacterized membrane protein (UPF0127 family)
MKVRLCLFLGFSLLSFLLIYIFYVSYAFLFFTKDQQTLRLVLKKNIFAPPQKEIVVEIAKTPDSITHGLSKRQTMINHVGQPIDGLLFILPRKGVQHFWMKEMLFALDICWLEDLSFVDCQRLAQANQESSIYTSPPLINLVLETQPGFLSDEDLDLKLFFAW